MRAHFIASTINIKEDVHSYRHIMEAIKKRDVELTSDWVETAYNRVEQDWLHTVKETEWATIYNENVDAVTKADIIIAEVSKKSFLVGFQVANALQMKKPILLLSKLAKADSAIGISIHEEIIKYEQYNDSNVDEIIGNFIDDNLKGGKDIRFNFFIDRQLLNYVTWSAAKKGVKKSEIIRRLIEKDMHESSYLKS